MSAPYFLSPGSPMRLLTSLTTGNGSVWYPAGTIARATVVLQGEGIISSGAVSIEEAYYDTIGGAPGIEYSGTWSVIQSVTASTLTATGSSAQSVVHVQGSVWALRVRLSTVIGGGGAMSAWVYGN